MSNHRKGTLRPVPPQFTTQAAQLIVTAYTDRPADLKCSGDLVMALQLLAAGVGMLADSVRQLQKKPADPPEADQPRKFLGPRQD